MADAAVIEAVLGYAVYKLSDVIIHVTEESWQFRSQLTQIQQTITKIKPMFSEIETLNQLLDRPKQELEMFMAQMRGAEALVLKCMRIKWNFHNRYTHAFKLDDLHSSMVKFFLIDVQLVNLRGIMDLQVAKRDSGRSSSRVPLLKGDVIGFDDRVRVLKAKILQNSVVVVSAPGGCGKTTLVSMLCRDPEIKEKFGENIYFVTISENPNLKLVIKNLLGKEEVDFDDDDDAIKQWGNFVKENESEILLVLDDVWSNSIIDRFKFKFHGYKILATSRTTFTQFSTYELKPLNQHEATNLFRHYAFSGGGNEHTDIQDDLVNKLVNCCKNHPLDLSVIGGLLKGQPLVSWLDMLKKLSDGHQSALDGFKEKSVMKNGIIGFEDPLRDLKAMILEDSAGDECKVVVVSAAGGCGKTTLVTMLCHDLDIQEKFGRNIYIVTISDTPNLKIDIKDLLGRNQADQKLQFYNNDEAINQRRSFVGEVESEILLVLDDVWSDSIIKLFMSNGHTILATSRTTFTQFDTYLLQPFNDQDAITLFRHYAFSEGGNEHTYISDGIVDKLVKCCKNHPLSLLVIGSLLKGTYIERWDVMLEILSNHGQQSALELDESIPLCLARSIDLFVEESVIKECFLDLGLFPEDQKISATMLMDLWVHFYNHDEGGLATINHLFALSNKKLATLLPIREDSPFTDNYCEEKAVTQHDLMRTLAISLSSLEPMELRKRLIISADGQDLPQLPDTVNARLLSISTDERFFLRWNDMRVPKVEVFVLNFMSEIYALPPFMQTMERLKILIITNLGNYFSKLQNFPAPQYFYGLNTIRLEHISISSISTSILEFAHLRKLSLIKCKIGNTFNECIHKKLPSLVEMEMDSCDDLITFPTILCNLIRLRKLSIINCLNLSSLSEEIGNLTYLEILRLASCSNLMDLPDSMRNLQKLRVIDLSDCLHLNKLPEHIGEMGALQTIHMRSCTGLLNLPPSIKVLRQLEVFCDKETSSLWSGLRNVKIQLVEEYRFQT